VTSSLPLPAFQSRAVKETHYPAAQFFNALSVGLNRLIESINLKFLLNRLDRKDCESVYPGA
jgi:hypothetical protein